MLFFKTPQGEPSCYGMDTDKIITKEPAFIEPEMPVEFIAPQDFESGELEESSAEIDKRYDALGSVSIPISQIALTMDSLKKQVERNGQLSNSALQAAQESLETQRAVLGFESNTVPSFLIGSDLKVRPQPEKVKVALESFTQTLKDIWEAIKRVIRKTIEFMKKAFKSFIYNVQNDIDALAQVSSALLLLRKNNTGAIEKGRLTANEQKYVKLPGSASMLYFEKEQPFSQSQGIYGDTYETAFSVLAELLGLNSAYVEAFDDKFVKNYVETCQIVLQQGSLAGRDRLFYPRNLMPLGSQVSPNGFKDLVAGPTQDTYVTEPYLGNMQVISMVEQVIPSGAQESLQELCNWKTYVRVNSKSTEYEYLRNLYDSEIEAVLPIALQILKNMKHLEATGDQVQKIEVALLSAADTLINKAVGSTSGYDQGVVKILIDCVANISKNSNDMIFNTNRVVRRIINSWTLYLQQIYKLERAMCD